MATGAAATSSGRQDAGAHGSPSEAELLRRLRAIIPPLDGGSHKGSHGKIGVVGGCAEYTGAPAFAALAALRCGADLAYVFCTRDAAPVIKSYSPELIVVPCLMDSSRGADCPEGDADMSERAYESAIEAAELWIPRLDCLIVGPGLGDDSCTFEAAKALYAVAVGHRIPVIIDGSMITNMVNQPPCVEDRLGGGSNQILTPNMAEMGRLLRARKLPNVGETITGAWQARALELAQSLCIDMPASPGKEEEEGGRTLAGPVIVSKGPRDVIAAGGGAVKRAGDEFPYEGAPVRDEVELVCDAPASLKRSGGQGDVLTGVLATLVCWAQRSRSSAADPLDLPLAAWGACWLTRAASRAAFEAKGRGMLAGDILDPHVADAVRLLERSAGGGGGGGGVKR
jgi:ATP-dependent NAD(P)H-hydrate dehydratase